MTLRFCLCDKPVLARRGDRTILVRFLWWRLPDPDYPGTIRRTRDDAFARAREASYLVINLGTGRGVTVRELVEAFERVWGSKINKSEAPPRPGDVAGACADAARARELLGWRARLDIEQGIRDALEWDAVREEVLS